MISDEYDDNNFADNDYHYEGYNELLASSLSQFCDIIVISNSIIIANLIIIEEQCYSVNIAAIVIITSEDTITLQFIYYVPASCKFLINDVTSKAASFLLSYDLSPRPLRIAGGRGDSAIIVPVSSNIFDMFLEIS